MKLKNFLYEAEQLRISFNYKMGIAKDMARDGFAFARDFVRGPMPTGFYNPYGQEYPPHFCDAMVDRYSSRKTGFTIFLATYLAVCVVAPTALIVGPVIASYAVWGILACGIAGLGAGIWAADRWTKEQIRSHQYYNLRQAAEKGEIDTVIAHSERRIEKFRNDPLPALREIATEAAQELDIAFAVKTAWAKQRT